MYSFTNSNDNNYVHNICDCKRKFKSQEMYICYNCNKVLCNSCLTEEIEYFYCLNYCQRNRYVKPADAKSMRNRCDQCLECPNCNIALTKKYSQNKHYYGCNYCNWDTSNIKFSTENELDLNGLIYQLKAFNNKGYLEKNYNLISNKLKSNEQLNKMLNLRKESLYTSVINNTVLKTNEDQQSYSNSKFNNEGEELTNRIEEMIKNDKLWEYEDIESKITNDFNTKLSLYNNFDYNDNYLADYKNNVSFQAVNNFLLCNLDYMEKGLNKVSSIEKLCEVLKYDYDISILSSIEKRHNNLISQYPKAQLYFPQFFKLSSKKSKRCKSCRKYIVQTEDYSKLNSSVPKFEFCHLFISQMPYCYINKVDFKNKFVQLKFVLFDYKEAKLSFVNTDEDDEYNRVIVDCPKNVYELNEYYCNDIINNNSNKDKYLVEASERCVILKFYWEFDNKNINNITNINNSIKDDKINEEIIKENNINNAINYSPNFVILRFKVLGEYNRLEVKTIKYDLEVKLS